MLLQDRLSTENVKNKAKTAKLRLVQFDETGEWSDEIVAKAGKIKGVYMYDANQHTYCCELMPSYTMIPLRSYADPDDDREIDDDTYYSLLFNDNNDEPSYMHVSFVDACVTKEAVFSHHLDGGLRYYNSDGRKYREIIEAAKEYFSGNAPY
jgi:hypothetical protein